MPLTEQWIAGFTDGEGTFHIGINKNETLTVKRQVLLEFVITQHKRDVELLQEIRDLLKWGVVRQNSKNGDIMCFRVRSQKDIQNIIIPFFERNPLLTQKKNDFQKFKLVSTIIEQKKHLTKEGIEKIEIIRRMFRTW